jgi:hypothetical protein
MEVVGSETAVPSPWSISFFHGGVVLLIRVTPLDGLPIGFI